MSKQEEILIMDAYQGEVVEGVVCDTCGKQIVLWLNGGELDQKECCGYRYLGRAKGYEVVKCQLEKN